LAFVSEITVSFIVFFRLSLYLFSSGLSRVRFWFGAVSLGFSVTFAALHSQKTPRMDWRMNSNGGFGLPLPSGG
jgi:hypothetical protein